MSGVTGGYELPDMGAGNHTHILWENSECFFVSLVWFGFFEAGFLCVIGCLGTHSASAS